LTTGSLDKAEQFKVIDPLTIEIDLPKPDRLAMPNLAVVYPIIINSKLAKQHATAEDPWAQAWLKENEAGSGAYIVESWKPGEQVVLKRNENWKGGRDGKLAFFKRVITQTIPEAATRANLVERGDADLSVDLPSSDVPSLMERGKVKVISTPQFNALTLIVFATRIPPFDNKKVRQAIAAALPYGDMFKGALFGRGNPLQNASWSGTPTDPSFPQTMPVKTDLQKARQLLTEAGYPSGFETSFSFNVGSAAIAEPMAALIKESLLKIGVKVDIQKQPDAQMSTSVSEKKLPFFTESIISWIPAPDYYFRNFFTGEQRWNYSSWNNPEINALSQAARFEPNQAKYDEITRKMVAIEADEMPVVLLWQPNQDAVMVPSIEDYTYEFHRQVDFRDMRRK
jgi:peptide/nickel transport system substrate-binding protein